MSWVTDMAGEPNPPLSNSMSWGSIEQYNTASQMNSFNTEAKKLAAVGVTIAVSSGDNGVINYVFPCISQYTVSFFNCACQASSSSSASSWACTNTWTGTGYFPSFPATSPYVTAVGAVDEK